MRNANDARLERPGKTKRVPYSHTRISLVTILLASSAAAIVAGMTWALWNSSWSANPPPVIGLPVVAFIAILTVGAISSCFTLEVRDGIVAWWFGFGAFRREIRLSAIAGAEPARSSWYEVHSRVSGRGARAYGASGGGAVELRLHDGSLLKLQASEPEVLLSVLSRKAAASL